MTDPLYELLAPYFDDSASSTKPPPPSRDSTSARYLTRLSTLPLEALNTTEVQSISQSTHSALLSLQALSNRSHKSIITSGDHLATLRDSLPSLARETQALRDVIPKLDSEAVRFSTLYSKTAENDILERRKKAMLLARNVDRLSDILELPTLLSTAVSSSSVNNAAGGTANTNYSSALDLFAHIKRLQSIYPNSPIVKGVSQQAEAAMKGMTTNLIAGLRGQNIRLAAAMRTVGWLRRVAPELEGPDKGSNREGGFGALFLVCRLANLVTMLEALDPLRELADQETTKRQQDANRGGQVAQGNSWSGGQQTERYLKRYIEIFREQSFAIVSLYKNIFASTSDVNIDLKSFRISSDSVSGGLSRPLSSDPLQPLPPSLVTFPMYLVEMLVETLQSYLPNVRDRGSRESLLTQVLYCAGSLGRLGGDFSMMLALLEEGLEDTNGDSIPEWEEVMKKHRALAGRLEQLTNTSASSITSESPRAAVKA